MNKTTTTVETKTVSTTRMTLESVTRGKIRKPKKVGVMGPEGIGKTTFGAGSPNPIFICAEAGTEMVDVNRFPTPQDWKDVLDGVRVLQKPGHEFKSLVIDTLDWIEPLIWKKVCEDAKVKSIEQVGGGYGKGYLAAVDQWRVLLYELELVREAGMNVILLAHSKIKNFNNPEGDNFDRWEMAINDRAAGIVKQWVNDFMFANYETLTRSGEGFDKKKHKGVDTGERYLYTTRRAAFDAKHRGILPDQIPLSWDDYERARDASDAMVSPELVADIERKAKLIGGEVEKITMQNLGKYRDDFARMSLLNNRLDAKLAELKEKEEDRNAQ